MTYDSERNWLSNIRAQADGGGNAAFFALLRSQIENRKAGWKLADEGGTFSPDQLTRLIQAAYELLRHVDELAVDESVS